ncbi:MAG TPA: GDYXXLXY domain-containing protein [Ohtaekwangia sp.]|uniref:GDYXXLXY domain-containing protein n=1 Tax=Ohtaekwangia sp. TaxID=2066019 RepID=UPI002F929F68
MKKLLIPAFVIMCLVQWFVPAQIIVEQETVLDEGTLYHFKTAPIDPADPFRGKYITLNFEQSHILVTDDKEWKRDQDIYVWLADSAGFAHITKVSMYEPEGTDFVKAKVDHVTSYEPYTLWIKYPFERFYMEESKAADAEQVYRGIQIQADTSEADATQVAYAVVSVKDGKAALKDVKINERSIVDVVRELNGEKSPE